MNTKLTIGAAIVAGAVLLFGLRECEGRRRGKDDAETQRQDSIATAQRVQAIAQRDAALAEVRLLREMHAEDSAFRAQTARQLVNLTRAYDRISRNVAGDGVLAPETSRDTAEMIGGRTLALIDSQRTVIARQDTTIRRDAVIIERLFGVADSLSVAFAHLDTAYQARVRERDIYKRQRYSWKDRVTVNACYGILVTGETGFCGSVGYTLVRPFRAIDSVTDLVRRVF